MAEKENGIKTTPLGIDKELEPIGVGKSMQRTNNIYQPCDQNPPSSRHMKGLVLFFCLGPPHSQKLELVLKLSMWQGNN